MTEKRLLGIKYWAQWYQFIRPRFEVFIYEGTAGGLHTFRSRPNPNCIICKRDQDLYEGGFGPFLIEHAIIEAAIPGGLTETKE